MASGFCTALRSRLVVAHSSSPMRPLENLVNSSFAIVDSGVLVQNSSHTYGADASTSLESAMEDHRGAETCTGTSMADDGSTRTWRSVNGESSATLNAGTIDFGASAFNTMKSRRDSRHDQAGTPSTTQIPAWRGSELRGPDPNVLTIALQVGVKRRRRCGGRCVRCQPCRSGSTRPAQSSQMSYFRCMARLTADQRRAPRC